MNTSTILVLGALGAAVYAYHRGWISIERRGGCGCSGGTSTAPPLTTTPSVAPGVAPKPLANAKWWP